MADIKILLVSSATRVEDVKNELKLCFHYMPTLLCIHFAVERGQTGRQITTDQQEASTDTTKAPLLAQLTPLA